MMSGQSISWHLRHEDAGRVGSLMSGAIDVCDLAAEGELKARYGDGNALHPSAWAHRPKRVAHVDFQLAADQTVFKIKHTASQEIYPACTRSIFRSATDCLAGGST